MCVYVCHTHVWFLFSSARSPGAMFIQVHRTVQSYMKERGKDIISLFRFPRVCLVYLDQGEGSEIDLSRKECG